MVNLHLTSDKELNKLKTLQENLEEGLISKKQAALTLKYAIEDIEAKELTVLKEYNSNNVGRTYMAATYEVH